MRLEDIILPILIGLLFLSFGIILCYAFIFEPFIKKKSRMYYDVTIGSYNKSKRLSWIETFHGKKLKSVRFNKNWVGFKSLMCDKAYRVYISFEYDKSINCIPKDILNNIECRAEISFIENDTIAEYRPHDIINIDVNNISYDIIRKQLTVEYNLFLPAIKSNICKHVINKEEDDNIVIRSIDFYIYPPSDHRKYIEEDDKK